MPSKAKVSLNPLPWVLTVNGFELSVPVLRQAFSEIQTTPFKAIHADPVVGQTAREYRELLAEYGLAPAPGYFSALFHETPVAEIVEAAKQHAAMQAELGNTEVFIAAALDAPRRKVAAVGADADPGVLAKVIDGLGAAAAAITAEGVRPVIHPHVGSRIEVEDEVHAVLAGIEDSILGFGPDTGHLTWAGMDAVKIMSQYSDRIGAMHLKDVHVDQAEAAKAAGTSYHDSTREGRYTVWTEPGRGDIDLVGAIDALPESFAGWIVVEVDVPEAPTNLESTQISAGWIEQHLGADAFTANQ
jgi:inosose dehydratase